MLIVVSQTHRSQEMNRQDALERLVALIRKAIDITDAGLRRMLAAPASRRLAEEFGVLALPTMVLIGADGNVIDRNVSINGLEGKLDELVAAVK